VYLEIRQVAEEDRQRFKSTTSANELAV